MINKILIIIVVIAVAGLIHFQAEAEPSDSKKIFSGSSAFTAAPDTAYLNPKETAGQQIGEFSKGHQKWQTYVSAAGFDKGKGEMYGFHFS